VILNQDTITEIIASSRGYVEYIEYHSCTWRGEGPVMVFRFKSSGALIGIDSLREWNKLAASFYVPGTELNHKE